MLGYADDSPEMTLHWLRQANLVGPAGLVSMEDGEAIEIAHRASQPIATARPSSSWAAPGRSPTAITGLLMCHCAVSGRITRSSLRSSRPARCDDGRRR